MESKVLNQTVTEQARNALNFPIQALIVEVACHNERFACGFPFLSLGADGFQGFQAGIDAETNMNAGKYVVAQLNYYHVAVAYNNCVAGEWFLFGKYGIAAVAACGAKLAVHAGGFSKELYLILIVGAAAVMLVYFLQCNYGRIEGLDYLSSALQVEFAVSAFAVADIVAYHIDGVKFVFIIDGIFATTVCLGCFI